MVMQVQVSSRIHHYNVQTTGCWVEVGFHSTKPFVSVHLVIWRFREGGGGCFVVFLLLLLILCYCRFYHKTRSPSAWNMSILISSGFSSNIVDVRRLGVKPATM